MLMVSHHAPTLEASPALLLSLTLAANKTPQASESIYCWHIANLGLKIERG